MNLDQFKKNGKFLMLAFDHRGSFKKLMNYSNPDSVTEEEQVELKKEVIDALRGQFSSILIDQETGYKAFDPKDVPFLLPIEKSGYEQQGKERITEIEYSVESIKQMGASGVKILLWLNYHLPSAEKQLETAAKVLEECHKYNLPLFLETRSYESDGREGADLSDEEMGDLVLGGLKLFMAKGIKPDVFKLEYPGSPVAAQTITAIIEDIPWILLTMGASFDKFKEQLEISSVRGCQGFLAGRAVWQEVGSLVGEEKEKFLKDVIPDRFKEISEIITK